MTSPSTGSSRHKQQIREIAKARLRSVSVERRLALSGSACERLIETPVFRNAGSVMLYIPTREEIDVTPVMNACFAAGKRVCLPRMDWAARSMQPMVVPTRDFVAEIRQSGITEPGEEYPILHIARLDLVLVPGLAFDDFGRRLGRGAGFYDRFIDRYRREGAPQGLSLGFGYEFQVFSDLPTDSHDQSLDGIVTDARFVVCRRGGQSADSV